MSAPHFQVEGGPTRHIVLDSTIECPVDGRANEGEIITDLGQLFKIYRVKLHWSRVLAAVLVLPLRKS